MRKNHKEIAEMTLDLAIWDVANCLSYPMKRDDVILIRKEVIAEVVRLSKEAPDA